MVVFIDDPLYHDTMRTLKQFYRKQFLGANTFTIKGFGMMGLTARDVIFEHFILGFKGMIQGLLIHRDISWLYYPFLLFARLYAYLITSFLRFFQPQEVV